MAAVYVTRAQRSERAAGESLRQPSRKSRASEDRRFQFTAENPGTE